MEKGTILKGLIGSFEIYNTTESGDDKTYYMCKLGKNNKRLSHKNSKNLMTMKGKQLDFFLKSGSLKIA